MHTYVESKSINLTLVILIILFPFIFIFQGLDFTDTGYNLSNYLFFFSAPESVTFSFSYWLTNLCGALWLSVFGNLGVFGIKLLGYMVMLLTLLITYCTLKPYIKKTMLLAGLFMSVIFVFDYARYFEYNRLTALLYALAAYFLARGLSDTKNICILAAGLILGLNAFARLSNFIGIFILLVILYDWLIKKYDFKVMLCRLLYLLFGFCLGVALVLTVMNMLGHFEIFKANLKLTNQISQKPNTTHNFVLLIQRYINEYIDSLRRSGLGILVIAIAGILFNIIQKDLKTRKITNKNILAGIFLMVIAICVGVFIYVSHQNPVLDFYREIVLIMFGFLLLNNLLYVFNVIKISADARVLAFTGILLPVLTEAGSDCGIIITTFSFSISICFLANTMVLLFKNKAIQIRRKNLKLSLKTNGFKYVALILAVSYIGVSLAIAYFYTFCDTGDRFTMTHQVDDPKLRMVFTTEQKVQLVGSLLSEVNKDIDNEDSLLVWGCAPMLHYLTGKKPFAYNAWIEWYIIDQFPDLLNRAIQEADQLPLVVIMKVDTTTTEWPMDFDAQHYQNSIEFQPKLSVLKEFISLYHYENVFENEYFEIYKYIT